MLLFWYNKITVIHQTFRYVLLKITYQTTALKTWIFSSSNVIITKISSNINEVIRAVLFFFIIRFHKRTLVTAYSKQNRLQQTKIKKYAQKTSKRKKVTYSLICVLCFYTFSAFNKNKEFKRSQETSFYVFTSSAKLDFICIVLV